MFLNTLTTTIEPVIAEVPVTHLFMTSFWYLFLHRYQDYFFQYFQLVPDPFSRCLFICFT